MANVNVNSMMKKLSLSPKPCRRIYKKRKKPSHRDIVKNIRDILEKNNKIYKFRTDTDNLFRDYMRKQFKKKCQDTVIKIIGN